MVAAVLSVNGKPVTSDPAFQAAATLIEDVRSASFPQLKGAQIEVLGLQSDFDFFQTRFTASSYFLSPTLHYMTMFNPEALRRQAPPEGLRAIVAHELAHIDYYRTHSRISLLGLVLMLSPSFATRFERQADLEAIDLGYGPGLQVYRAWLYRNIPPERVAEKKRDYFSPEEIAAILQAKQRDPTTMATFFRCVPRSLAEIEQESRNPAGSCPE